MTSIDDLSWNPRAFLSKQEDIIGQEVEFVRGVPTLGGEEDEPSRAEFGLKCFEVGVACNGDMIDIVHRSPTDSSIVPLETHWLDQIYRGAKAGA